MATHLDQRIEKLESIEKVVIHTCNTCVHITTIQVALTSQLVQDIGKLMSLAANAVSELCKPAPSTETVEYTTKDFVKTLDVSQNFSYHFPAKHYMRKIYL